MSSLLLLFLPKLLRGTRDRWVAQVSFIIIHSTGLTPFPRLSAPPHSSQWRFAINVDSGYSYFSKNAGLFIDEYIICNDRNPYLKLILSWIFYRRYLDPSRTSIYEFHLTVSHLLRIISFGVISVESPPSPAFLFQESHCPSLTT